MAKMNLDLSKASVATGFTTVPSGVYSTKIVSANPKETAKGGFYLEIGFQITDGEHSGKTVADRLNIVNANPDTQSWALNNLKTIMTVGGHKNPNMLVDTDELLGLELKVTIEASEGEYDGKKTVNNNFKGYFKAEKTAVAVAKPVEKKVEPVAVVEAPKTASMSEQKFPWS